MLACSSQQLKHRYIDKVELFCMLVQVSHKAGRLEHAYVTHLGIGQYLIMSD